MDKEDPDYDGMQQWLKDIIEIWNSSGLIGKAVFILACIGASTTLTSLSGAIIEWRGLIADMLAFYGQYVRDPIAALVSFISFDLIHPSTMMIDAVLFYFIYFSAEKRVIGKLKERSALNASMFLFDVIVLPIAALLVLLLALYLVDEYLLSGAWVYAEAIAISIPLLLILLSIYGWIRSLLWLAKGNCPDWLILDSQPALYRKERISFLRFLGPIIVAFLTLAVLASVNAGLCDPCQ